MSTSIRGEHRGTTICVKFELQHLWELTQHPYGSTCRAEERARTVSLESEQLALRKLVRQLRAVHEELTSYRELLAKFRGATLTHHEALVAANRTNLGDAFFAYLDICIKAAHVSRSMYPSSDDALPPA